MGGGDGGGFRQINTCLQVPLLVNFQEKPFGVFIDIWSMIASKTGDNLCNLHTKDPRCVTRPLTIVNGSRNELLSQNGIATILSV